MLSLERNRLKQLHSSLRIDDGLYGTNHGLPPEKYCTSTGRKFVQVDRGASASLVFSAR